MTREKRGTDGASTSKADGAGRNRATPASLFKLYHAMTEDQKNLVTDVGFGGLLKIGSGRLPSAISKWLLSKFDAEKEQLVIPGRGKIKANAAAVRRILDLPMGEDEVKYEFNGSAINFINGSCNFENCKAPRVCSLREKLQGNKEATHEYLRGWLMLAISTFLCGSTSLTISPKCYPALVDLDKVKDLNWYQFVVDTLKTSVRKMDTQNTVLGCQYFLTILYLDTLELPNSIQVPEKQPRVAAWNMKLINKVIKLDTYPNRTFGKLRLKKLDGSVTETSILGDLNDIENLISERAPRATSAKKKRRVSQVIRKACIGITEVIGTMISEFFAISDDSDVQEEPRVRRSKRTRPSSNHRQAAFVVDDDDDDDNDVDYVADEDEEKEVDEEDESKYEEEDLEHEGVELEDEGVELEDEGVDLHDEDVYADGLPPVILAHSPEPWGKKVSEKKGDTPASTTAAEGKGRMHCAQEPMDRGKEPMPLEVVLPHKFAKEKLRLPCSTVAAGKSEKPAPRAPWDFSPPSFDLGIESPEPQPNKCSPQRETDHYYDKFWDYLRKAEASSAGKADPTCATKGATCAAKAEATCAAKAEGSSAAKAEVTYNLSAPSTSRTPAYQPAARRAVQAGRALRSPYVDYGRNDNLKCTKFVTHVYDVVCRATRATTRSSSQSPSQGDNIIISFPDYYVHLKYLSESVKPGGKLASAVAEIGICALNDTKCKFPVKRVLPLRIATLLQNGTFNHAEINTAFRRSPQHLDRSQLVMFPVLQNIPFKRLDKSVGHYFLLVLNLREERFEVLDSMRSIADKDLEKCCNRLITSIKELWRIHYPNSAKCIDNYQLIDIQVPRQTNNHDCGFHMLMHCENWNGHKLPHFKEKDMATICKLLTYKWLRHPENDCARKTILGIK